MNKKNEIVLKSKENKQNRFAPYLMINVKQSKDKIKLELFLVSKGPIRVNLIKSVVNLLDKMIKFESNMILDSIKPNAILLTSTTKKIEFDKDNKAIVNIKASLSNIGLKYSGEMIDELLIDEDVTFTKQNTKGRMRTIFKQGEMYRPNVHVLKVKNGLPTILKISGMRFILEHKDQFKGK